MTDRTERDPDERGLSARHLILIFLTGVAVCGVFFSLGFLVGYNERSSKMNPVTEHVSVPSTVPPTVNPPMETETVGTKELTATPAATPPQTADDLPPVPKVRETKAPAPAPVTHRASAPPAGEVGSGFTVQVTASRAKEDAESLLKILKSRGYPVFIVSPRYSHAGDNLYRVQVGPFTTRDNAEKVQKKLEKEGFKPFIRH